MNLKNPENLPIMIFTQSLGYLYMILMVASGFLIINEPLKIKSSTGLSKDYLLMIATSYFMLTFNDVYGFFGNSSYKNEVHISDVMLSFIFTIQMVAGLIEVHVIPGDSINKFSYTVKFVCIVSIQTSAILCYTTNIESTTIFIGIIKSAFSIIQCIPQYILIYHMKSTKGFSIATQVFDIVAFLCATIQIIIDYYVNGNGNGFWHELNQAKFLTSMASIFAVSVFLFQHQYYKYFYKSRTMVESSFYDITLCWGHKSSITLQEELDMRTVNTNILGFRGNRKNSDLILKKMKQNILDKTQNFDNQVSARNLSCMSFSEEKCLLVRTNMCNSENGLTKQVNKKTKFDSSLL